MATPLSAASSYCTVQQLLGFYDARWVGQKLLDIGQQAEADAILAGGSGLPENSVVQQALDAASGQLEAACLVADRYSPTDLQALTGVSAKFLAKIVADVAVWNLMSRRNPAAPPPAATQLALGYLRDLEEGKAIFGLQEVADAGLPDDETPTTTDINFQNRATNQASRLFGQRAERFRPGTG